MKLADSIYPRAMDILRLDNDSCGITSVFTLVVLNDGAGMFCCSVVDPWSKPMVLGFLSMGEAMQVNFLIEYKRLCLLRDLPGGNKKQKVDAKALARRMLARQVTL